MISPQALDAFMNAPMKDWNWIKEVPKDELRATIQELYPDFDPKHLDPFKHQLASFFIGMSEKEFLFLLDMSLGKAQPLDSKILTPSGWRLMGDLKEGDFVSTPDGGFSEITCIFPQGIKEIFEVKFSDGSVTQCCDDHLWKIYCGSTLSRNNRGLLTKMPFRILSTKFLKDSLLDKHGNPRYYIPISKPAIFNFVDLSLPNHLSVKEVSNLVKVPRGTLIDWDTKTYSKKVLKSDFRRGPNKCRRYYTKNVLEFCGGNQSLGCAYKLDPYLLGALLGDGHLGKHSVNITIGHDDEKEMLGILYPLIPAKCKLKREQNTITHHITATVRGETNEVFEYIRQIGLLGKNSYDKYVPNKFKFASIIDRTSLLQGLLDTDGYIDKNGTIVYSSSSKKLTEDVIFLVQSLGGTATFHIKKTNRRDAYWTTIKLPFEIDPFRLTRKLKRRKKSIRLLPKKIMVSITSVGLKPAQCIKINSKDELYITDNFIVTHNTVISLWILAYLKWKKRLKSALVVVPNTSVVNSWSRQIRTLSDLKVIEMYGTTLERTELLKEEADIFIINYTGLQRILTDIVPAKSKGKLTGKNRWMPSAKKVKELGKKFNVAVFDEIHYCKEKGSLNFKLCNRITNVCEYRYGLSGTPFGRDPSDLWAEFYLIDKGETLGNSLGVFREAFFNTTFTRWGTFEHKFKKSLEGKLHTKIMNKSIRYTKDETELDLPPMIPNIVPITFSVEALSYYQALAQKWTHTSDLETRKNNFIKFRQITAGYLNHTTDDGEKIQIIFDENPKIEALRDLIESAPADAKIVIFNDFILSGDMISELLKEMKIKFFRLYSGTPEKDKRRAEEIFNETDCRIMLLNDKSGSVGLNLQIARYVIFYECPVNVIDRKQGIQRIHRPGQTQTTFLYDLVMTYSVDEKILGFMQEGHDLEMALLNNPSKLLDNFKISGQEQQQISKFKMIKGFK